MRSFWLLGLLFLAACTDTSEPTTPEDATVHGSGIKADVVNHVEWAKDATIYEVNIRQHTPEGTIAAFEKDIPRIKDMGVDILWLMPIHPIGELNRKGGKGSYYSVKDYYEVNPEFGTMTDFQNLVSTAHSNGMKVILDWVANHSAWDNDWVELHPEYYSVDSAGNMHAPVEDWSDVVDLNYDNEGLRAEMIKALKYWIEVADVDGYRCDVADWVPVDFWEEARIELEKVNPDIFMLAEAENPRHHDRAFDMSYSWEFMHIMNQIAMTKGLMSPDLIVEKGWHDEGKTLASIDEYMAKEDTNFVRDAYRMTFITNHDENSWNGTVFERFGDAHELFAVMASTINGMPLVYSGQEAGNAERLLFFEKDTIAWGEMKHEEFYTTLLKANKEHEALWNGMNGGEFKRIKTSDEDDIYCYSRTKGESSVVTVLNFSNEKKNVTFLESVSGEYTSIFNGQTLSVFTETDLSLEPWGYQVFAK